jgi:hypothetical protein
MEVGRKEAQKDLKAFGIGAGENIFALCDIVRETSYSIHQFLRHGHLEKANEHIAQLLGYLRACRIEHGLLVNFGAPKLEIRKFALSGYS